MMQAGSRAQSRVQFEQQTGYAAAGGAAVQEALGRGRSDLPYSGREAEMEGGVMQVSQDVGAALAGVASADAGGARGTRKNFFR